MKCPNCGTELPEDSAFCPECGAEIENNSRLRTSQPQAQGPADSPVRNSIGNPYGNPVGNPVGKKGTSRGLIAGILGGAAVLILAAAAAFYFHLIPIGQSAHTPAASSASSAGTSSEAESQAWTGSTADAGKKPKSSDASKEEDASGKSSPAQALTPAPVQAQSPSATDTADGAATDGGAEGTTWLYVVNCQEWISLRSAANTSASVLTTIPLGEKVAFLSDAGNGFDQVTYNGITGYALSSYLSAAPGGSGSSAGNAGTNLLHVINCREWISLRSSPDTSASVVCTIPLGAEVTFISAAGNGFDQISYNGLTGYALAEYLG